MRRRTSWLWLLSTIAFTTLTVVGMVAPLSAQEADGDGEAAPRPPLWSGTAATSAFHLHFNTEPTILPVAELINLDLPYGAASWDSSGSGEALASSLWPGTAVTEGPSLLCDFGGGCPNPFPPETGLSFPPGYPAAAKASTTNPEASTRDGAAKATVTPEGVTTDAGASEALAPMLGPLGAVVDVDSVDSSTELRFVDGALVSRAVSVLQGVSLLDGTIEIDGIEVVAESRSDGEGTVAAAPVTTIAGVSVGGQPARITQDGVEIAGEGGGGEGVDGANEALAAALEGFGADVRLISTSQTAEAGTVRSTAGGIVVSFNVPLAGPSLPTQAVPGAPLSVDPNIVYRNYVGAVVLGTARSAAFASTSGFGGGSVDVGDLSDLAPPDAGDGDFGSSGELGSSEPGSSSWSGGGLGTPPSVGSTDDPSTGPRDTPDVAAPGDGGTASGEGDQELGPQATALTSGLSEEVADGVTVAYGLGALASAVLFALSRLPRRRIT